MENKTIGQIAYEGYLHSSGGKSLISGQELPAFADLSPAIQDAWESAADAVVAFAGRADMASATTGVKH